MLLVGDEGPIASPGEVVFDSYTFGPLASGEGTESMSSVSWGELVLGWSRNDEIGLTLVDSVGQQVVVVPLEPFTKARHVPNTEIIVVAKSNREMQRVTGVVPNSLQIQEVLALVASI